MVRRATALVLSGVLAGAGLLTAVPGAVASSAHSTVASAVPREGTPQVLDGTVFAIAQVGDTMIVGGSFTRTESPTRRTRTPRRT